MIVKLYDGFYVKCTKTNLVETKDFYIEFHNPISLNDLETMLDEAFSEFVGYIQREYGLAHQIRHEHHDYFTMLTYMEAHGVAFGDIKFMESTGIDAELVGNDVSIHFPVKGS